ncbi:hypothetical protein [Botryobacter ruber]|uniref:hypothetical protein n=1 Tax=Botryobacter ruber TaxID=2171629 RepID=UPI000E0A63D6|nr:hypothetical protein [Botryobacter ruber]
MKLNDIPKHNIYKVPEGYFDSLPMRVMEQTAAKGAGASAAPRFSSFWQPVRLVLAPLVLLLVFVGVFLFSNDVVQQQPQPEYVALGTLPEAEIVDYLDSYARLETSDFDEVSLSDQELTAEFLNISSEAAEEELEYYQLNKLIY